MAGKNPPRNDTDDKKSPANKQKRDESWKLLRVRRRIKAGYYDRKEVRDEIVESLLEALMRRKGK